MPHITDELGCVYDRYCREIWHHSIVPIIPHDRQWNQAWTTCQVTPDMLNSLWPGDTLWQHRSGSTLSQVMASCLTASSHYLDQCWPFVQAVHNLVTIYIHVMIHTSLYMYMEIITVYIPLTLFCWNICNRTHIRHGSNTIVTAKSLALSPMNHGKVQED